MKHWLSANLPDRESLLRRRWLRPLAHRLAHPSLWHFNRWSVSRGLALGLFCGFLVPLGQVVLAGLFAMTLRANLVVAAAATLVTNPLTLPAIYYAAYRLGARITGGWEAADAQAYETFAARGSAWLLSVSLPTAIGLAVFAILSAAAGYFGAQLVWRFWVRRRWARRADA